nr:hypothetical protein [Bradyrhizobium yuanmingense]
MKRDGKQLHSRLLRFGIVDGLLEEGAHDLGAADRKVSAEYDRVKQIEQVLGFASKKQRGQFRCQKLFEFLAADRARARSLVRIGV